MKAYRIELLALDFEGYGAEQIRMIAENARGLDPTVMAIEEREIGEWSDDHPLNHSETAAAEFARLFGAPSPVQGAARASCEAKGAAVKPWRERHAESIGVLPPMHYADAEIADWRALAERAQAQPKLVLALPDYEQRRIVIASDEVVDGERLVCVAIEPGAHPSGAVAEFLTSLLNDRIDVWSNYVWMVEESKAGPDPILGTDEDACRERISKARAALAWLAATPAPEQEAAPKNGEDGYVCPAGKAQAAVRAVEQEAAQVAPPGAQEAVYLISCGGDWKEVGSRRFHDARKEGIEVRILYTAPVAQEAEQPQGDVMPPFAATASQHDTYPAILFDTQAVYDEAKRKRPHGSNPTPMQVADTLDAVVRLIRRTASTAAAAGAARQGGNTCAMCNDSGIVGRALDDCYDCPDCSKSVAEVDVEAERKLYEAHARSQGWPTHRRNHPDISGDSGDYMAPSVEAGWKVWVAARTQADAGKDAERFRRAIAVEDNAETLYVAVMNHAPDGNAIRAEFDAMLSASAAHSAEGE